MCADRADAELCATFSFMCISSVTTEILTMNQVKDYRPCRKTRERKLLHHNQEYCIIHSGLQCSYYCTIMIPDGLRI